VPFIDVSQGVPRSGPPEILSVALADVAGSDEGSAYGPICGDVELHELLVDEMKTVYSHNIDISTKDAALTAGCNLAFFATAMALASFGDEIILPVPW
jgi:aspartate/methionine/tyrosine aminotransferase